MAEDRPLLLTDFNPEGFICEDGKIVASVITDDSMTGDGTEANPLVVKISTDPQNVILKGTDGGVYAPPSDLAPPQLISSITDVGAYASGADQLRHSDGQALPTLFDFAEGFKTVKASTGCGDTGVGADVMVNAISISGDELIVESAPEHYSDVFYQGATGNAGPLDISLLGTYTIVTLPALVINNPSDCRDLAVFWQESLAIQASLRITGIWDIVIQHNENSGGWLDYAVAQYGPVPGTTGLPLYMFATYINTIVAGGSLSVERRVLIRTQLASDPGSQASVWAFDARGHFTTK